MMVILAPTGCSDLHINRVLKIFPGMAGKKQAEAAGPVSKTPLVYVEGNIGSGKSTLLECLYSHPDLEIIDEPIQHWQDFYSRNLLAMRNYGDTRQMQFLFQMVVFLTRINQLSQGKTEGKTRVVERSILSAFYVFCRQLVNEREIEWLEYNVLTYTKNILSKGVLGNLTRPDLIIYLRTTPEKCMERIKERGRIEERNITVKYLTQLHKAHEAWLTSTKERESFWETPCPVVILNGDVPEEESPELVLGLLKAIEGLKGSNVKEKKQEKVYDFDRAIRKWQMKRKRGDVIDSQGNSVNMMLRGSQRDIDLRKNLDAYYNDDSDKENDDSKKVQMGIKTAKALSMMGALGLTAQKEANAEEKRDRELKEKMDRIFEEEDQRREYDEMEQCEWLQAMEEKESEEEKEDEEEREDEEEKGDYEETEETRTEEVD